MRQTRLWVAATIIASIILAGFALSVPHARDGTLPPALPSAVPSTPIVAVHEVFKKGLHTITGSLSAPNACTSVSATATLAGASSTQYILIALSMPTDAGMCLQEKSTMHFSTTLSAPAHLPITIMVNGSLATTTAS